MTQQQTPYGYVRSEHGKLGLLHFMAFTMDLILTFTGMKQVCKGQVSILSCP